MRNTQDLAQQAINEYLKVGDLAIDAGIKAGDVTRFLSARVGDDGHVMAFSTDKNEIDDAAMSLFLSGLNARVEFIQKDFSAIPEYLSPTEPVGVVMFQVDENTNIQALVDVVLPLTANLKKNGLLIFLTEDLSQLADLEAHLAKLPADSYDAHSYRDLLSGAGTLMLQRI
jgi:tRNA A58 N-methylase Trm61